MATVVLTVVGPDRPGLVESLSDTLAAHRGNWQESRMARLANQFAGILLATLPDDQLVALKHAFATLSKEADLHVTVQESTATAVADGGYRQVQLELLGQDRPGIVLEISQLLAQHGVSIDDLETHISSASWSGDSLFHAKVELRTPKSIDTDALRTTLEQLANELMVDVTLADRGDS